MVFFLTVTWDTGIIDSDTRCEGKRCTVTYDILIQPQPGGTYRATALGWPDLNVIGDSEQTVLERIRQAIRERLAQGKVVRIEIDGKAAKATVPAHPWLPFLGMWRDDPTFEDLLARMETYRRELDETSGQ